MIQQIEKWTKHSTRQKRETVHDWLTPNNRPFSQNQSDFWEHPNTFFYLMEQAIVFTTCYTFVPLHSDDSLPSKSKVAQLSNDARGWVVVILVSIRTWQRMNRLQRILTMTRPWGQSLWTISFASIRDWFFLQLQQTYFFLLERVLSLWIRRIILARKNWIGDSRRTQRVRGGLVYDANTDHTK